MPWEPRIRVDARDMARAEIRPRAAPPKPRRRRVHVPRPTPTRVSSEEDDAETDAAAAVALVVAAAQDAETADAATDAAVCRSRPRGPDDDTVSTLTTRRPPGERRYKGTLDCLTKIYRVEGVRALFKGAGYNALRTITAALSLVVYGEATKKKKRG